MQANSNVARGRMLPGNTARSRRPPDESSRSAESPADTIFAAGTLGLIVMVITIAGSELHGLIPDTRFWRALPLLLVIPPAVLLGTLFAPGGALGPRPSWTRVVLLGLVGFGSYAATLGVGLLGSALAHAV